MFTKNCETSMKLLNKPIFSLNAMRKRVKKRKLRDSVRYHITGEFGECGNG